MKYIITILMLFGVAQAQDTMPMRFTYKSPAGKIRTVAGYGILAPDTALNRMHNNPGVDSLPHAIMPVVFLDRRKRPVAGLVVSFDFIFKQ